MHGAGIKIGDRVYLANCIAGEPGVVHEIDRKGYASVEWVDVPEIARWMSHHIDTLVVDEGFKVEQIGFDFERAAA